MEIFDAQKINLNASLGGIKGYNVLLIFPNLTSTHQVVIVIFFPVIITHILRHVHNCF